MGALLKNECGLQFNLDELAELEEMVPRDPELDPIKWIAEAATVVAERVTEIS